MTLKEVIEALHFLGNKKLIEERKAKFGIVSKGALGISLAEINHLAKSLKKIPI